MATLDDILESLTALHAKADALAARSKPASAPVNPSGGACFGNYGRNKGGPVYGASMADLEYYGAGCRRTLDDPSKSRFHDRERALLAAIQAEIARQNGGSAPAGGGDGFGGGIGDDDGIPFGPMSGRIQ